MVNHYNEPNYIIATDEMTVGLVLSRRWIRYDPNGECKMKPESVHNLAQKSTK